MSKINSTKPKAKKSVTRLAGGMGNIAAKQSNIATLKRLVLANLLWEDNAYVDGKTVSDEIAELIPLCQPKDVFDLAVSARAEQRLRHTPLYIAAIMAKHTKHRALVGKLLPKIITRADMITDFVAIYKKLNGGSIKPLANQVKLGLAESFDNFDEYQFAKYDRDAEIKLRDVMRLVRPKAKQGKEELYKKVATRTLNTPDTWEVALSTGKDKKETWTRLINTKKIGGLAMLRNINNMKKADVDKKVISEGISTIKKSMLLPLNYLTSARMNPEFEREIEDAMVGGYANLPKLPGRTLFIVDVSGSMGCQISSKSTVSRKDAASAMAMLAANQCEDFELVATAGYDSSGVGKHEHIKYPQKGFGVIKQIGETNSRIGSGGIFTRQCIDWCRDNIKGEFDRIIVFSDSQDCDRSNNTKPSPFGRYNYICDVSAHKHGVNYKGVWSAEISGWSEHFMTYIAAFENIGNNFTSDENEESEVTN